MAGQVWYQRARSALTVGAAVALVVGLGAVGWGLARADNAPAPAAAPPEPPVPAGVTTPSATAGVLTTTAARATSIPTRPRPKPRPTRKPPAAQLPPPPPKPKPDSPSCTKHPGPDAPASEVAAALAAAGAENYWHGVAPPAGADLPADLNVPADLMDAIAFTESSWRSTVVACDGGIGLMQLMPDNVTFLDTRFGRDLDVHSVTGNTQLGAEYLEWLTVYFGLYYYGGSYDLMTTTGPVGTGGTTLALLDVVIAAYNVGFHALEDEHGTVDASDDTLSIPNPTYLATVKANLADCPCT